LAQKLSSWLMCTIAKLLYTLTYENA